MKFLSQTKLVLLRSFKLLNQFIFIYSSFRDIHISFNEIISVAAYSRISKIVEYSKKKN